MTITHDGIVVNYMYDSPEFLEKAKSYALRYKDDPDKCQNCVRATIARGNVCHINDWPELRIGYICDNESFIKFKSDICCNHKRNNSEI